MNATISPKGRIMAAYTHAETDRVAAFFKNDEPPITCGLMNILRVKTRDEVLSKLGIDLRIEYVSYAGPPLPERKDGRLSSHWGTIIGPYAQNLPRPLAHVETVGDVAKWKPPDPGWFDYEAFAKNCARWSEHAVMAHPGFEPLFCGLCNLVGMENGLAMLLTNAKVVDAILHIVTEFVLEKTRRMIAAAGTRAQIFFFGDDFASDKGLIMGYRLWKRFFMKPMTRIIHAIRSSGCHAHVHCCGAMAELIPDFIDMGVQSIEPCQFHLEKMDPGIIKREYGDHIVFYGGVDSQHLLPRGSAEDVRRETRRLVDILGRGGGYVCGSDHSLLSDIPPQNIIAMYKEIGCCSPTETD